MMISCGRPGLRHRHWCQKYRDANPGISPVAPCDPNLSSLSTRRIDFHIGRVFVFFPCGIIRRSMALNFNSVGRLCRVGGSSGTVAAWRQVRSGLPSPQPSFYYHGLPSHCQNDRDHTTPLRHKRGFGKVLCLIPRLCWFGRFGIPCAVVCPPDGSIVAA